jgi:hypothetical protein
MTCYVVSKASTPNKGMGSKKRKNYSSSQLSLLWQQSIETSAFGVLSELPAVSEGCSIEILGLR